MYQAEPITEDVMGGNHEMLVCFQEWSFIQVNLEILLKSNLVNQSPVQIGNLFIVLNASLVISWPLYIISREFLILS